MHGFNQGEVLLNDILSSHWFDFIFVQDHWLSSDNSHVLEDLNVSYICIAKSAMDDTAVCKACHSHLRHIRRSLSTDMATSIAVAMVNEFCLEPDDAEAYQNIEYWKHISLTV